MWIKAAREADLQEGKSLCASAGSVNVALFKKGGKVYALHNACAHRGGPLGEGYLEDEEVICPWHAWGFNVRTGKCSTVPGVRQPSYPARVENGEVWVDVDEKT